MYPTITDLIKDLFGVYIPLPIQSFGFFVALAFIMGAYVMAVELKRKEGEGLLEPVKQKKLKGAPVKITELIISAIIGFALGYKMLDIILNYGPFVEDPQSFILSSRGSFLGGIIGGVLSAYLKYREKEKNKLDEPKWVEETLHPYQLIGNIVLIAAAAGLLGAKIFHNLENIDELIADPVDALISFSGLTFYGGLICGTVAVLYYVKKKNIGIVHMVDIAAPALFLAYGIGRIGCQVAGDGDWGIPNDLPQPAWLSFLPEWVWAYDYPNNVFGVDLQKDFARMGLTSITGKAYPTPIYESTICILLFGLLWVIRKKITIPGVLFCIYLVLNGIERFFIEKIRINEVYHIFEYKVTQAEIISVVLIIVGVIGIWYFMRRERLRS
ncbi:MAG: prolipoprotein diacylglyceryl transferase family protein [Bacteroidota bacterium]